MRLCFFSLFSHFWSSAILHISSGLKNASWLFKREEGGLKAHTHTKEPQKPSRKSNYGLRNLDVAPPRMLCSPELTAQVFSAFSSSWDLGPWPALIFQWFLSRKSTGCCWLEGRGRQLLFPILNTLFWGQFSSGLDAIIPRKPACLEIS